MHEALNWRNTSVVDVEESYRNNKNSIVGKDDGIVHCRGEDSLGG